MAAAVHPKQPSRLIVIAWFALPAKEIPHGKNGAEQQQNENKRLGSLEYPFKQTDQ
jgi:hypothetical protein